ncbi:MAG: YpoC family protein [Bacillota bacterium]|uniref:YpoC family protein n=1 Tax=Rossellomorea sp. FM04394 TaxID=3243076 RepID=UPI0035A72E4B
MKERILYIPSQLIDPFFFPDSKVRVDASHIRPDDPFFAYEILYFNEVATGSFPWIDHELYVGTILKSWGEEEEYLKTLYKKRSKNTLHAMKKSISQFYMLLFWSNSLPVRLNHEDSHIDQLSIKPANAVERIEFIRNNPTLFHSFIQLSQLFEEQHKQYAKSLALKRSKEK